MNWLNDVKFNLKQPESNIEEFSGSYFICDGGYLRWPQLICPVQGTCLSVKEAEFTAVLERTRTNVECCFGILKKRWKILKISLRFRKIATCHKIFVACCMIHNIIKDLETYDEEFYPEDEDLNRGLTGIRDSDMVSRPFIDDEICTRNKRRRRSTEW